MFTACGKSHGEKSVGRYFTEMLQCHAGWGIQDPEDAGELLGTVISTAIEVGDYIFQQNVVESFFGRNLSPSDIAHIFDGDASG